MTTTPATPSTTAGPAPRRRFSLHRLLFLTLDPVHIGTGGVQLGRVDLSIAREPGTRLPKIPGTSLSGAARAYAAYQTNRPWCAGQGQGGERGSDTDQSAANGQTPEANGQQRQRKGHCGQAACPVCYAFGSLRSEENQQQGSQQDRRQRAMAGTVNLFDAHILLFPVTSSAGPVWVSTASRLTDAGFTVSDPPTDDATAKVRLLGNSPMVNLGWLLLGAERGVTIERPSTTAVPDDDWNVVENRLALVTDRIFSQVVNANLEVRTSVSIDPFTGAAETGALFSYEAIPRATWLVSDVIEDDYRGRFQPYQDGDIDLKSPFEVARLGLTLAELLGVGGMGTRGFGRLRLVNDWTVPPRREAE